MRHTLRFLTLAAVVILSGCAFLAPRRPAVDLVDVRLGQIGLFESAVVFELRITNDNAVGLTIEDGLYELFVEGVQVGRGRLPQPVVIPRRGSQNQQIILHVDNLRLLQQIRSVLATGRFDYRVEAQHFVRGFNRPFISTREGQFELPDRGAQLR